MQVPLEVAFRDIEPTDELNALILHGIDKLETVYPNLISCRAVVADTTPGRQSGNNYRVRLEISVPHKTLIVDEDTPESDEARTLQQTVKATFAVARKRLQKAKELQRGDVKTHELPPHGRIVRLLTADTGVRYGFLESREGRQVYFHEDALVDLDYEDVDVGDEVRYTATEGNDGPQASMVASLNPSGIGPVQQRSIPLREQPRD